MSTHPEYPTIDEEGRITLASQLIVAIFVFLIPTAAAILAGVLAYRGLVTKADIWILIGMYVATGIGVTVGYHRLFTHRSFETSRPVRWILAILGGMAAEGAPIIWAAQHRPHHAFSDERGDPHSPNVGRRPGFWGFLRSFWHSHYGHVFNQIEPIKPELYTPDLAKDRFLRFLEKAAALPVLLGLLLPFGIGYWASGSWTGAWTGLLWGGLVRLFILTHAVGSVNSLCHIFGSRPFNSGDLSRNVWWLMPLTFGEAWHNGHHAFPTSARHGLRWWELDPSWMVIWLMEKFGLAWNVIRIPRDRQEQKASKVG
jgi:stearoyl-CoA desaturase (Delta-9 desaturase)